MSIIIDPTKPMQPEEILQVLRAVREHIPDFVQMPAIDRASLRRLATAVDPEFVQESISAVGVSNPLKGALGTSAEQLQQDSEFTGRWSLVASELRALLDGVLSALAVRRHRLSLTALQVYNVSRQLARRPENANLLPHIRRMRERNTLGRKRVKQDALKPAEPAKPGEPEQPGTKPEPQSKPQ